MIGALSARGICAMSAHHINALASASCSDTLYRLHNNAILLPLKLLKMDFKRLPFKEAVITVPINSHLYEVAIPLDFCFGNSKH